MNSFKEFKSIIEPNDIYRLRLEYLFLKKPSFFIKYSKMDEDDIYRENNSL